MSGPAAAPHEPRQATAWMRSAYWSVCRRCGARIETGEWQALFEVPGQGRWWVHESCALELGAPAREPHGSTAAPALLAPALPVRIVVIGSGSWPRDRAVEVRDALEAVARGHREVVIVHSARRDQRGRPRGVDAWAELTATRLGYLSEPHDHEPRSAAELRARRPDVVVAFELQPPAGDDQDLPALIDAAEHAGIPVLVHHPHPAVAAPPSTPRQPGEVSSTAGRDACPAAARAPHWPSSMPVGGIRSFTADAPEGPVGPPPRAPERAEGRRSP